MQLNTRDHYWGGYTLLPFIAAVLFLFVLLSHHWIPTHDTLGQVIWYQQILSHLVDTGSVPVWYAGLNWGHPLNTLIFVQNTPSLFLVAPLAFLFPQINSVTLFYLGMFLSELILLGGVFALGSRLFRSRLSTLFIAAVFSATVGWATQCWWNFHLYYALPFAFYFIHCGTYDRAPWKIGLGFAIAVLTGVMGNLLYLAPVQVFICLLYLGFCLKDSAFTWRDFKLRRPEGLVLVLLLLSFCIPAAILVNGDETEFWIPQRDASGKSSYVDFLQYGHDQKLHSLQGLVDPLELGFHPGFKNDENGSYLGDNSTYAGAFLIPLLLLCLLFSRSRARLCFLWLAAMVFLLYLSRASFLAPLFYELPGLNLFRHFGLLTPLIRFFLILLAGFGFDELVTRLLEGNDRKAAVTWLIGLALAAIVSLAFLKSRDLDEAPHALARYVLQLVVLVAAALWIIRRTLTPSAPTGATFLIILALVDGYSFRSALYHQSLHPVSDANWKSFELEPPQFVPARTANPIENPTFRQWFEDIFKASGTLYAVSLPFLKMESCVRRLRTDYLAPASADLVRTVSEAMLLPPRTAQLIGCESPKTMVFSGIGLVSNQETLGKVLDGNAPLGLWTTTEEWIRAFSSAPATSKTELLPDVKVAINDYHWNHLTFVSKIPLTSTPSWFVLTESWSPQWQARVNGKSAPILIANGGFRAIPVPAGPVEIELTYDSRYLEMLYRFLWLLIAGYFLGGVIWMGRFATRASVLESSRALGYNFSP